MSRPSRVRRHQPGEDREQHDGGYDDDDLHIGQPHHEAVPFEQGVTAGNDRRHRLDPRAPAQFANN